MTRLIKVAMLVLLVVSGAVQAADPLVIRGGNGKAISIAVVPFGGDTADAISSVVGVDLYNSGIFDPLPKQNMISMPHQPQEIAFRDWSAVGAQFVLVGNLSMAGGRVQTQYFLYNVASQQQVFAGTASGGTNQLRALAHYISDQVFEKLTGIEGAFSTKLMYVVAHGNTDYSLQLADYDGANSVTLARSQEPIISPRFSNDGKRILYVSFETRRPRIYMQDLATGSRQQLTDFQGLNGAPAWSPDGSKMAFVLSKDGNPEIYLMNLATRSIQRLTNNNAIDTEPFWGSDGRMLYFTSDRSGKPQIYRMNVGTGATERVTTVGNYNANPKLSADEKMLVMVHRQEGYRNFSIAAQDLQTGRVRVLSNTNFDDSPTIAPNGTMVIYATRKQDQGVLMLASVNGRVRVQLPINQGDLREPSWSPYIK